MMVLNIYDISWLYVSGPAPILGEEMRNYRD